MTVITAGGMVAMPAKTTAESKAPFSISWFGEVVDLTAKTKYRNFETNIPRKGLSGTQSQFPHSCACERLIYSHDRSPYSAGGNM
jgi:hypothetical protein